MSDSFNMNSKLLNGKFSPTRFKTLDCKWKYELQYNKKIYPLIPWQSPEAILGSYFHMVAELWDDYMELEGPTSLDPVSQLKKLKAISSEKYAITAAQLPKAEKMVDNFQNYIVPVLKNPYEGDPVKWKKKEQELGGSINIRGKSDDFVYSLDINLAMDVVMELESGKIIIIDYKTGSSISMAPHMFQLLFYAYVYSQKYRTPFHKLEMWVIFPDAPANKFIHKLTGDQVYNFMSDFEDELVSRLELIEKGPFHEEDTTQTFMCKFCQYYGTELCMPSMMMHGAEVPDNKNKKFKTGWPPNEVIVDPKKIER